MVPARMKAHFAMMSAYNAWANRRLFGAANELTEDDYRQHVGVFFGSLHNTLSHLYVTDVLWMARLRGESGPPWLLDHIPHASRSDLTARRKMMDCDIRGFVLSLDDTALEEEITYRRVSDATLVSQPKAQALAHLFNHQTHHRGQAHAILSILGQTPPALDLLLYQREA